MPYSTSPFGIIRIARIREPSNLPLINLVYMDQYHVAAHGVFQKRSTPITCELGVPTGKIWTQILDSIALRTKRYRHPGH